MGQLVSKSGKGSQLWRGERIERIFVVFVPVSLHFFTLFVTRRLPRRPGDEACARSPPGGDRGPRLRRGQGCRGRAGARSCSNSCKTQFLMLICFSRTMLECAAAAAATAVI